MRYFLILFVFFLVSCGQKAKQTPETTGFVFDTSAVIVEGQEITKAAFKTLSSNLKQAMVEGGVAYAIQFCKVEAMPLTDSLSRNYDVKLRRASHRPRNPSNRADSLEMESITKYINQIKKEMKLEPMVHESNEKITFHAPIRISNALCLNCHGKPGIDITNDDLKTIEQLYPEDQATGFEMGELRGLWTISFPKSHFK